MRNLDEAQQAAVLSRLSYFNQGARIAKKNWSQTRMRKRSIRIIVKILMKICASVKRTLIISRTSDDGVAHGQYWMLKFDIIPTLTKFSYGKSTSELRCSGWCHPNHAMPWIKEIELAKKGEYLRTSQSITERVYPKFEALDARFATGMRRIIKNSNFKEQIFIEEQNALKEDRTSEVDKSLIRSTSTSG